MRRKAMIPSGARSLWLLLTATVVGFAASVLGCASAGPLTPVAVSDIKSVAGKWSGVVYSSSSQPEAVELTIREDGSYDVRSLQTIGASRGRGKIVIREGRLIIEGEKGRGTATVLSTRGGDRVMNVDATLNDNSILSAKLSPSR